MSLDDFEEVCPECGEYLGFGTDCLTCEEARREDERVLRAEKKEELRNARKRAREEDKGSR